MGDGDEEKRDGRKGEKRERKRIRRVFHNEIYAKYTAGIFPLITLIITCNEHCHNSRTKSTLTKYASRTRKFHLRDINTSEFVDLL